MYFISIIVPNQPINVSASQINGSRVQVSWSQPEKPNGHLEGYSVYYRSQQTQRPSTPQIIRVSAAELSLIIESDFQGNVTYEFWVKAKVSFETCYDNYRVLMMII